MQIYIRKMQIYFGSGPLLVPTTLTSAHRCRVTSAHTRQSGPDSGRGFHVKFLEAFQVDPSVLGSGPL